jgi:hypothetical protein
MQAQVSASVQAGPVATVQAVLQGLCPDLVFVAGVIGERANNVSHCFGSYTFL